MRRRVAEEQPNLPSRLEIYPTLTLLLRSLPDDGDMRVRNGVYAGRNSYGYADRLPEEMRNVRVDCWLHGARQDTGDLRFAGNLELLLGTTEDPTTCRFMIAEIPAGRDLPGEPGSFEPVRRQVRALLGDYLIRTGFDAMIPTRIQVEGSLFFDGWRQSALEQSAGPSSPQTVTVWEIQPVVAIAAP